MRGPFQFFGYFLTSAAILVRKGLINLFFYIFFEIPVKFPLILYIKRYINVLFCSHEKYLKTGNYRRYAANVKISEKRSISPVVTGF